MIKDRIKSLRDIMNEKDMFAYIIPSSDYHQSEYVGDYFKGREFISGFTGSAGTVVITKEEAGLWTDGRYFIQAENELKGSDVKLFKMGEEGVPTVKEYIETVTPRDSKIGFDGKVFSAKEGLDLEKELSYKNVEILYNEDLLTSTWKERRELPKEKAFLLNVKYAGETFSSKLARLREAMKEKKSTMHVIATLDDVAWLFNIRGRDIKFNPVVLSYSVITLDNVYLFVDEEKLNDEIKNELNKENVIIKPYFEVYEFVKDIDNTESVLIDPTKLNYCIYKNIPADVKKIESANPTVMFKAKKNEVELENIRNSHVKDGVAFTKFMYWLKTNVDKIQITELSASERLEELRKEQEGFIEPSFGTIAGYREHAAMMHYSATEESQYTLENKDLFLIDSGGQYFDGTTDITRTLALGEVKEEQMNHFTNVVRGMIRLSRAKFLHGCRGINLDILARGPLWDNNIDYKCGTGHGIGFLLNVHEPPNGFRWKMVPERDDSCVLEEGMVTTNEPGVYMEGSHGIRIENEIVVRKSHKNEYGQFMDFEVVTFAPIDLDAINPSLMLDDEKAYLNEYHKDVYDKISPYLDENEKEWLKNYTKAI